MPSGWTVSICIGEGSTGHALTCTSISSSDMTEAKCAAFCAAAGYTLAADASTSSDDMTLSKCASTANPLASPWPPSSTARNVTVHPS
ncbi:hypothetical protein AYX15_02815 [Cryptococcus neoformans]|nr:hypothetical protein AYX15_02815 [Cryptococcus neoformans var. grubii]